MSDHAAQWVHTNTAQRVLFGPGLAREAGAVLRDIGSRRAMLVTTEGRLGSEDGQMLVADLGRAISSVFSGVRSHVPTTTVREAVAQAGRDRIDAVVSFGGGSCMDTAKACCYFSEQQAGAPGVSYLDRPLLSHLAVPTTYSGAELTQFFGMTDEQTRVKGGAGGPTTAAVCVLYDPLLSLATPVRVSAETGMNALAHGVECAYSTARSPEAAELAVAAVAAVASALPAVVEDPEDPEARAAMLVAAMMGARALQNASMGVAHGLSQLLGGRTGIAHGLANAIMLAPCLRFNAASVPDEAKRIGEALGAPRDPAGACDQLRERLGLPSGLSECGVSDQDVAAVARMSQANFSVAANPRRVTEQDALAILKSAR